MCPFFRLRSPVFSRPFPLLFPLFLAFARAPPPLYSSSRFASRLRSSALVARPLVGVRPHLGPPCQSRVCDIPLLFAPCPVLCSFRFFLPCFSRVPSRSHSLISTAFSVPIFPSLSKLLCKPSCNSCIHRLFLLLHPGLHPVFHRPRLSRVPLSVSVRTPPPSFSSSASSSFSSSSSSSPCSPFSSSASSSFSASSSSSSSSSSSPCSPFSSLSSSSLSSSSSPSSSSRRSSRCRLSFYSQLFSAYFGVAVREGRVLFFLYINRKKTGAAFGHPKRARTGRPFM